MIERNVDGVFRYPIHYKQFIKAPVIERRLSRLYCLQINMSRKWSMVICIFTSTKKNSIYVRDLRIGKHAQTNVSNVSAERLVERWSAHIQATINIIASEVRGTSLQGRAQKPESSRRVWER